MFKIAHIILVFTLVAHNCNGQEFVLEIPEECKQKGFCESVPNYPTEQVQKILSELSEEERNRFQLDTLDDDIQASQRLGNTGTDQEIELCSFVENIIYPQSALDNDNNWHIVINPKDKPLQGFRAEMCNSASESCNSAATIQEGYKGGCKQKFVYRMMVTVDKNGNHAQKPLKLPSCCTCVLTVNSPLFV